MLRPGALEGAVALVAVAEHGGFAAAARVLGVAQSTVSRQVSALEHAVGAHLLARTTRSVRLTEAGQWFYERARTGLAAILEAERGASSVGSQVEGVLRVTMPEAFGRRVIVPALAKLCALHTKLRLELDLSDEPHALERGGFDAPFGWVDRRGIGGPARGRLRAACR
jgi:DNA-binding transcriptional LysR family regulator